jgi:2-polyprenyl-3-methyl-5-hydroxy-6-metoxy-1,4-benzoquinol methylase
MAGACVLCGGVDRAPRFTKGGWRFVRCRTCGLESLDPLPTGADLAAHYDASYDDGAYAEFAAAGAVRDAIARHRLRLIRPLAPAGPWLDVGASTGAFVAAAVAEGLDAEGVEVSDVAAAAARRRGLAVHTSAVEDFQPPRRYAVVTAFDVVEHLLDPLPLLARVRGWLAPGGLLAIAVPNAGSWVARLLGRQWFYYVGPFHVHYFSPATIRRALAASGYPTVTVRSLRKPLTLRYAADQLATLAPPLAPLARGAMRALPWLARPIPLPLGEMLVTARAGEGSS